MPTGTQQTIEGLLCVTCRNIMHESTPLNDQICTNCDDQYIRYCDSCGDCYMNTNDTPWEIRNRALSVGMGSNGFIYTNDTGELVCIDCAYFCENCQESYQDYDEMLNCCDTRSDVVNCYSYRPRFNYYRMSEAYLDITHVAEPGLLYMGVEIEVNKMGGTMADEFIDDCTVEQKGFIYLKEDGSLGPDGVEIVTMPSTLEAFKNTFPFDALDNARRKGARSFYYANCGFHIHVARSAFTPTHMWKFIRFQLQNPLLCQRVAQRDESSYASWYFDESEKRDLPEYVKGTKTNGRRYLAINFQNHATVELRYFKGNILPSAILKNLEFVQSMYNYTKNMTVRQVMDKGLSESKYMLWLDQYGGRYPNLIHFLDNDSNEGDN